jgi:hypothetical protein
MPRSVRLALAVATLALFPTAALAGKRPAPSTGLSLTSEYVWSSPNPAAPSWCLNEDDWHVRSWSGSLNGSFTASERLCDETVDFSGGIWWDAGGIGLQADLFVTGTLQDLAITSPQGDSHHAVFVGSTTSKGITTNQYRVCFVPPFALASNSGGQSLAGGTWQIALAGDVGKASLTLRARMADVPFQQQNCPPSQQNLV